MGVVGESYFKTPPYEKMSFATYKVKSKTIKQSSQNPLFKL
ncbi:hypothetical protein HPPN120_00425 [Helicobacter pylori Puno120]|nr:hypothetical protein HPPN120_00425 [Helicobacter pylori Puno120]